MSALNSTAVKSPTEGMIWSSLRETVPKDKRTEDCARILLNSAARADNEIPQLNRQIEILGFLEVFFGGSSLASSIVTFTAGLLILMTLASPFGAVTVATLITFLVLVGLTTMLITSTGVFGNSLDSAKQKKAHFSAQSTIEVLEREPWIRGFPNLLKVWPKARKA